jgi:hypothetical protein
VPRNEVREVLLARLEPGSVRFGRRAAGYTEHPGGGKDGGGGYVDVDVEVVNHDGGDGASEVKIGGGAGRPEWSEVGLYKLNAVAP